MAIRRPSVYRQRDFVFQDFLYFADGQTESRYILGKYDGEPYELVPQTFDYPSPNFKGGDIISRLDYTVTGKLLTLDHWEINWRDEWPLRLTTQFLINCLYTPGMGFSVQVRKEAYPFWVSESFFPVTNSQNDTLIH